MNKRFSYLVTIAAAFTTGLCTGLMMAPESGKSLRRRMSSEARSQLKSAEAKLEIIEDQLIKVNERIQLAGQELGDKVRDAAGEIIPDLSKDSDSWNLTKDEVEKDLRHMSRR